VSGVFPAACAAYTINRAVMRAPDYAYGVFRTLWLQTGGVIDGGFRLGAAPASATLLYEHQSLPLPEIIRLVNKFSNNVMARHLLLTLGAEAFGAPATVESGRNAVRVWLAKRGLQADSFTLDNGSGLSRAERMTARGLGEMLDVAWHSPFMPEFAASLPLSATDGTLRNRFDAPGMQGRIRLKTGRIDDVSALAGYVNAASGKTYVVVIIINHPRRFVRSSTDAVLFRANQPVGIASSFFQLLCMRLRRNRSDSHRVSSSTSDESATQQ
jgi:D-alanyl-D-alanine carboxypeptidase/D-alanyl-D-alanine-endopeptidase (penicillin-binding protein 4)